MAQFIKYLPLAYDILAVVLLLYYIRVSSRRGFAATIVNFVGYAAALVVAWPVSKMLASTVFERILRPELIERVTERMAEFTAGEQLADSVAALLEALPAYVSGAFTIGGYSTGEIALLLEEYSARGAQVLVDEVFAPVIQGMLSMVMFLVLFSVFLVVVKAVVHIFYRVREIPLIGPLNAALGGVMGLFTGVVTLYILMIVLQTVLLFSGNTWEYCNSDILEQTYTHRLFLQFDPFGLLS